jgi:putative nucleotidyltransferase with HDIG domain
VALTGPPRFVTRTLIATLAMIAFVLTAVFVVVTLTVRDHVRRSVVEKLETGQRLLATLEQRRTGDLRTQIATLAENPTLKAALDTYEAERQVASAAERSQLIATIGRELEKLAAGFDADVLAARDLDGEVLAASGRRAPDWTAGSPHTASETPEATFLTLPSGVFRAVTVPITLQHVELGSVQLAQALDDRYATELSTLSGARTLIVSDGHVLATTLPPEIRGALTPETLRTFLAGEVTIGGEKYAIRPLLQEGSAAVYVLDSIDASARPLVRSSLQTMAAIAVGAFGLAALASLWLARTISRPIDILSQSLSDMTRTRTFDRPLTATGASLEIDTLTDAFNTMIGSIQTAEGETRRAYLEAIRALALALDARDPHTAGHSERVSALSVAIGRQMRLDDGTLEVLRLGALLHDIGKIGISDDLLSKPAPLTADEYETVKTHTTVGSRILRSVRFLEPHLSLVELHHERPDGRGYPYGLSGNQIPVAARIVHAADAYDAMTTARAYRAARPRAEALAELQRCAGTDFDADVLRALMQVVAHDGVAQDVIAHAAVPAVDRAAAVDGTPLADEFRSEADMPKTDVGSERPPNPLDGFDSEGQVV